MQGIKDFRFHHCVTQRLPDGRLWSRRFRVGFDLQMALRYIHATDEVGVGQLKIWLNRMGQVTNR